MDNDIKIISIINYLHTKIIRNKIGRTYTFISINTPKEPNIKRVATNNVPISEEDDTKMISKLEHVKAAKLYILKH